MAVEQRLGHVGLAILCLLAIACGHSTTPSNNDNPCPDPSYPLVCSTIGCCPDGYPYACSGHCQASASACAGGYTYCVGSTNPQDDAGSTPANDMSLVLTCGPGTHQEGAVCVPDPVPDIINGKSAADPARTHWVRKLTPGTNYFFGFAIYADGAGEIYCLSMVPRPITWTQTGIDSFTTSSSCVASMSGIMAAPHPSGFSASTLDNNTTRADTFTLAAGD